MPARSILFQVARSLNQHIYTLSFLNFSFINSSYACLLACLLGNQPGAQWTGIVTTIAIEMLKSGMVEAVVCVQRYHSIPFHSFLKNILLIISFTVIQMTDSPLDQF